VIRHSVALDAGPSRPVTSSGHGNSAATGAERTGKRATSITTPLRRNSQATSDSVQAVTSALSAKIAHATRSPPSVERMSFQALRPMIAMTAAPMPQNAPCIHGSPPYAR